MGHATSPNQQVESCTELKLVQAFFNYSRILASLLEKSQLALAGSLLVSINLHLSGTVDRATL